MYKATGTKGFTPYFHTLLAEAYLKDGNAEEGLPLLAEAVAVIQRSSEQQHEVGVYRLKGELILQQSKVEGSKVEEEAEACFLLAIEIAQKQQAKSWELRTATSLARLWQQQEKRAEARDLLAPVYNWFTEGFDTADLQDAKELLDALS